MQVLYRNTVILVDWYSSSQELQFGACGHPVGSRTSWAASRWTPGFCRTRFDNPCMRPRQKSLELHNQSIFLQNIFFLSVLPDITRATQKQNPFIFWVFIVPFLFNEAPEKQVCIPNLCQNLSYSTRIQALSFAANIFVPHFIGFTYL